MTLSTVYDDVVSELLKGIENFYENKITYQELSLLSFQEELFVDDCDWSAIKNNLRKKIFEHLKRMFLNLNTLENNLNILKGIKNEEVDINEDEIFNYGMLIGRNKLQPEGCENSQFYVSAIPQNNVNEAVENETKK